MIQAQALLPVSVIVPVRNGEATLEVCLESLLRLDYPAELHEILCVDNGSTDRTPEILRRFDKHVRIEHAARRGAAAARNQGIRAARHPYVAFTDADCVVDPAWLRHLVPPLHDSSVGIVGGAVLARIGANAVERFGEKIHNHRRAIEELIPPYAITMSWASPRALLLDVGSFDERLLRGQDAELAYRIGARGCRLVYAEGAIVRHHNESTVRGLFLEGYTHGRLAPQVRDMHVATLGPRPWRQQIRKALRRVWHTEVLAGKDGPWRDHAFAFLFNLGKALGEARGHVAVRTHAQSRSKRPRDQP